MGKNNRKNQKGIGKLRAAREKLVNDQFEAYIKKFEKKYEKEPSQEQIDKMYKKAEKVVSKDIRRFGVRAAAIIGAIGISFGAGAIIFGRDEIKGITDGKNEITLDAEEVDKDIVINNFEPSKHDLFVNELKNYEQPEETQETTDDIELQIESEVSQEITQLKTEEDVLNYGKEIYAECYNELNDDKIDMDSIILKRSRQDFFIYEDTAQNGDIIHRIEKGTENAEKNNSSKISISAKTEMGEKIYEQVTNYNYGGSYYTLYNNNETVEKYEDNNLADVAEIVDRVIDVKTSMNNSQTSIEQKEEYKNKLINAVVEYRLEKQQDQNAEIGQQTTDNDGR